MQKGIFTISLDFELYWGVRDHRTIENYGNNIDAVHQVVPRLLELFKKYEVHCTWATVGFLLMKNKEELLQNLPKSFPEYLKSEYDPYPYIREQELVPKFHFAPDLVAQIKKTPGQEIGTHTFSHFYALERNTTVQQFTDDLSTAIQTARNHGVEIISMVFPRNQYSEEHIAACNRLGIKTYRGNESSGAYKPVSRENENIFRRAIRFADTYINLTGHHIHPLPGKSAIINIPASRFLRFYSSKLGMLDGLKFRRIKKSMEKAAATGMIYHLWWHPHNFGDHMDQNFSFLEKILEVYNRLKHEEKMESLNMFEIYERTQNAADEQ